MDANENVHQEKVNQYLEDSVSDTSSNLCDQSQEGSAHEHPDCYNIVVGNEPFNSVNTEERTIQVIPEKVERPNDTVMRSKTLS